MSNAYYSSFGVPIPYKFRIPKKQRNGRANARLSYDGPAWQLRKALGIRACFYSLKWHHLFLSKNDAAKHLINDPTTIKIWKEAIKKRLKPPYFYCIEVGLEGEIHVHVIAHENAGLLGIKRGGEVVKLIKNTDADWRRVVSYMYKTPVPLTVDPDDINEAKLPDWQERLESYYQALARNKSVPFLSDYVLK